MSRSAVMVFSKILWKMGGHGERGAWNVHLKRELDTGRKKVNQLRSNRDINLSAHNLL